MQIYNITRNVLLADKVEVARSFFARGKGLMGRKALPDGFALVILPEWSIHTFFMRVPIDVLFVDTAHTVVGLREAMPPNRPFAGVSPLKGHYVIELPAGLLAVTGTVVGDQLQVTPGL
ncbi:MAG: DUF192 domain-containing protein [Roseiflexaceae bacterium]|nr:DUF192 domain-containing protein [Roseiflexaceae bacterium]